MEGLKARDLMTSDVVVVPPELPALSVVRRLNNRSISAVPVVGADGAPLGIITRADLDFRLDPSFERPSSWFTSLAANPAVAADHRGRVHGLLAQDVMTNNVVVVGLETPAAEIAALMERQGVRRALVVDGGCLRGLVSSTDLLRDHAVPTTEMADITVERLRRAVAAIMMREILDDRIRRAIVARMRHEPWTSTPYMVVEVKDGAVEFHGFSAGAAEQLGLRVLAEQVPGVKSVADHTQPLPHYLYEAI
jgi:CBS domain-containing protein